MSTCIVSFNHQIMFIIANRYEINIYSNLHGIVNYFSGKCLKFYTSIKEGTKRTYIYIYVHPVKIVNESFEEKASVWVWFCKRKLSFVSKLLLLLILLLLLLFHLLFLFYLFSSLQKF